MRNKGFVAKNALLAGSALYILLAILAIFNPNIVVYFLFLQLPGFFVFLVARYLRRYLGSSLIAGMLLFFSASFLIGAFHPYYENRAFSILYFSILTFADFLLLLSSTLLIEDGHWNERIITSLINGGLGAAFILSIFYVVNIPCNTYRTAEYLTLTPVIFAALVFIATLAFSFHPECKNRPGNALLNLGLSLLFWGLALGFPSMFLTMVTVASCSSCIATFSPSLFFFTFITLPTASFILGWDMGCRFGKDAGSKAMA